MVTLLGVIVILLVSLRPFISRPRSSGSNQSSRDAVLGRIQGIHKVAPDLDVFLDVLSLRSGQEWGKKLWREIPARDIFYLFWSRHARKSQSVEKEWRCALSKRGIEFIDPKMEANCNKDTCPWRITELSQN